MFFQALADPKQLPALFSRRVKVSQAPGQTESNI